MKMIPLKKHTTSPAAARLLSIPALVAAMLLATPALAQDRLLVCGDTKVLQINYPQSKDSLPAVEWEWDATRATELPDSFRLKRFRTIDDCKPLQGGRELLVSSSSGAIAWINREQNKVLFYAAVPNAHSIEMLPGNRIVAAASVTPGGNRIMLFDPAKGNKPLYQDSLYSGHGVVWHAASQTLFALGEQELREYQLTNWHTDTPSLSLIKSWPIPGVGGHDLQLHPDGKALLVTETQGSWVFNLEQHTFVKQPGMPDGHHVKSVGLGSRHQYVYTQTEESWWTYHVKFANPARSLAFPQLHVYKARWAQ